MSDEEIQNIYNDMVKLFGEKTIPNPEHYPRSFKYYVDLWKYINQNNDNQKMPQM